MAKYYKKKPKPKLNSFLTIEEIDDINRRIPTDELFYDLYISYSKKLTYEGKATLYDYIKENRYPRSKKILGTKTVPYYETEDDMILPEYKWEDLPSEERNLLNIKKSENDGPNIIGED
jgi:hypothetical protein